jgi:hypothetical protein
MASFPKLRCFLPLLTLLPTIGSASPRPVIVPAPVAEDSTAWADAIEAGPRNDTYRLGAEDFPREAETTAEDARTDARTLRGPRAPEKVCRRECATCCACAAQPRWRWRECDRGCRLSLRDAWTKRRCVDECCP